MLFSLNMSHQEYMCNSVQDTKRASGTHKRSNKQDTYISVHQLAVVLHFVSAVLIGHVSLFCVLVDVGRKFLSLVDKRAKESQPAVHIKKFFSGPQGIEMCSKCWHDGTRFNSDPTVRDIRVHPLIFW